MTDPRNILELPTDLFLALTNVGRNSLGLSEEVVSNTKPEVCEACNGTGKHTHVGWPQHKTVTCGECNA